MKKLVAAFVLLASLSGSAQTHRLEKQWQTDTVVAVPESVLPAAGKNLLYVSLIDGAPWEADGKGGVATLTADGKTYNGTWVTGLNAPKGMGVRGNKLYVADISEVTVIDVLSGTITKRIAVEGAQGLNDVAVTGNGVVYVSDSRRGRVWKLENDRPRLYLDSLTGINGLKAVGTDLYIGAGKAFLKADKNRRLTKIADLPQNIDGIEPVGNGDFLLTAWLGYVFYVSANGSVEVLLETHAEKSNTADIGYDPKIRTVYVPTFGAKTVTAYRLQ